MPRGGYRPNSGPLKGTRYLKRGVRAQTRTKAINDAAAALGLEPLAYMLAVMRDESVDIEVRARMAIAAAPFCHPKAGGGREV